MSLLSEELATSLRISLRQAAACPGLVSLESLEPEPAFRHAVQHAIAAVERRGSILRRFLTDGPYEARGSIPLDLVDARLSDDETESAITILYSHAVNAFKGQITELLALGPVCSLFSQLKFAGDMPPSACLYLGDAAKSASRRGAAKGADCHVVHEEVGDLVLDAVVEVKSYHARPSRLSRQLGSHETRAVSGLRLWSSNNSYHASRGSVPRRGGAFQISVCPSNWKLSREYSIEQGNTGSVLHVAPLPAIPRDTITRVDERRWHVVLGWSQEALAAEAYRLTYWYVEQLGAELFREGGSPWPEMSAEESGANAAKRSLYYSIMRARSRRAEQRAIALYNAYGFGYALGTSYKDRQRRRWMLWFEDLEEMQRDGMHGRECWLHGRDSALVVE